LLEANYPAIARHMYSKNVRVRVHSSSAGGHQKSKTAALDKDVKKILRLAKEASPSRGPAERGSKKTSGKCSIRLDRVCR
jgi:hypothetical protein